MKKVLIIINPFAGKKHANNHLVEIIELFCKAGYETTVATTGKSGDGTVIARERAADFDMIVCIGGDGTFNEVVAGILESGQDVPIGYIPAGTTNDFAASLGIPRSIMGAARAIVEGVPRTLDLGSFNERYFSYVASFGAFTATSYSVPQNLKNLLGHTAYVLEGIKDIPSIRPLHLKITNTETEEVYEEEYVFGAICNSTSMGGVLTLKEELVDMNDGKFEVLLIRSPRNIIDLTQITMALTTSKITECSMMDFFSSGEVIIEAPASMPWTLDGEYQEGRSDITIRNLRSAIRIIVSEDNKQLTHSVEADYEEYLDTL